MAEKAGDHEGIDPSQSIDFCTLGMFIIGTFILCFVYGVLHISHVVIPQSSSSCREVLRVLLGKKSSCVLSLLYFFEHISSQPVSR